VESDTAVFAVLQKNVDKILRYVDNSEVRLRAVKADAGVFLSAAPVDGVPFDFIFLDPPFAAQAAAERCLELIAACPGWLAAQGLIFYQFRGKADIEQNDWRVIDSRTFGDSVVARLMRNVDL
jgi:16S rRNA G966 N2-methylase RsmD